MDYMDAGIMHGIWITWIWESLLIKGIKYLFLSK